jgi:hypothetical protein
MMPLTADFTGLTSGFSKKIENLAAAVSPEAYDP